MQEEGQALEYHRLDSYLHGDLRGEKSIKWVLILEITFPKYPLYCPQRYDALGRVFIVEKCPGDVIGLRKWGPTQFKRLMTVPLRHVRLILERLVHELYRR